MIFRVIYREKLNIFLGENGSRQIYVRKLCIEKIIVIINNNNSLWTLANYVLMYSKK